MVGLPYAPCPNVRTGYTLGLIFPLASPLQPRSRLLHRSTCAHLMAASNASHTADASNFAHVPQVPLNLIQAYPSGPALKGKPGEPANSKRVSFLQKLGCLSERTPRTV